MSNQGHLFAIRRLLPFLYPKNQPELRWRVVGAIFALIVSKIIHIYAPIFYTDAVDHLNLGPDMVDVTIAVGLIVAYAGARIFVTLFQEIRELLFVKVAFSATRVIATSTFKFLHQLSHHFHLNYQTGGVARVIERGQKGIEFLLNFMLFNIIPTILEIILVSILLWNLFSFMYAFITFVTIVSYIIFTLYVTEWRLKFRRQMNQHDTKANASAVEALMNFETIKYFNKEQHETSRYHELMSQYMVAGIRSIKSLSFVNVGQTFIISVGLFLLLYMATMDYKQGIIKLSDFVLINTYLLQLYLPLGFLGFVYREIRRSLTDMEEMFTLLNLSADVSLNTDKPNMTITKASIQFDKVYFAYERDKYIINDLSFTVHQGQKLAIVGSSGSGKTTIARLLFRFYDYQKGHIMIDNQDIQQTSLYSLREKIGIVPQDTILFNDTIGYNIAYGAQGDVTQEDIENASKIAKIHDFIMSLDQQYHTLVGERGLRLSGGEKQRVAIARAILKNAPILILDEATSSLDTSIERDVQESLNQLMHERTTIIIAHRLSTITHADHIIVLDKGKIAEQGTHEFLLNQQGIYASLWQKQSEKNHNMV